MLKLGETGVSALYLGDAKIKKAYLGSELVFEEKKPSRLPAGYTEVSYLETDMNCRIPLNYAASFSKTRILYEVEPLAFVSSGFIISGANLARKYFYFRRIAVNKIEYRFAGGGYSTLAVSIDNTRVLMDVDFVSKMLKIGEVSAAISSNTNVSSNLFIGKSGFNCIVGRIYSLQVYESGEKILEFVPCVSSLGVPGLYELENETFHDNTGKGTITPGPAD